MGSINGTLPLFQNRRINAEKMGYGHIRVMLVDEVRTPGEHEIPGGFAPRMNTEFFANKAVFTTNIW